MLEDGGAGPSLQEGGEGQAGGLEIGLLPAGEGADIRLVREDDVDRGVEFQRQPLHRGGGEEDLSLIHI